MSPKKKITLERNYDATIEDVWELWTTKEGIEAWWGPDGFAVTVQALDLRPGGELRYTMTATGADQIAFMKRAGMPLATRTHIRYDAIAAPRRLAYTNFVDFVPGVAAYEAAMVVELSATGDQVRMILTLDAMHDEQWTRNMVMGWESETAKLAKILASRRGVAE
jgi:uncharacterized protein YndB with AHSA1/START domain